MNLTAEPILGWQKFLRIYGFEERNTDTHIPYVVDLLYHRNIYQSFFIHSGTLTADFDFLRQVITILYYFFGQFFIIFNFSSFRQQSMLIQ